MGLLSAIQANGGLFRGGLIKTLAQLMGGGGKAGGCSGGSCGSSGAPAQILATMPGTTAANLASPSILTESTHPTASA